MSKKSKKAEGNPEDRPKPERTEAQKASALANLERAKVALAANTAPLAEIVEIPLPDDGAPQDLQDMRHVIINTACFDRTEAQKQARLFNQRHPGQFRALKATLEKEHRVAMEQARARDAGAGGEVVPDEGTERCEDLIGRLLEEFEGGEVGK